EGRTGVFATVSAVDPQQDAVRFEISGGPDAQRFTYDEHSGELSYTGATPTLPGNPAASRPDFSAVTGDADGTYALHGDNSLQLQLTATDSKGHSTVQQLVFALQNDVSDDAVLGYREAHDMARLTQSGTNQLPGMAAAGLGTDASGDNLVLSIDGSSTVRVTELNGQGGYTGTSFGNAGTDYADLAVADFDLDGRLDVALVGENDSTNILEVWGSDGAGAFTRKLLLQEGDGDDSLDPSGSLERVTAGEFSGDGRLDLFVGNDGGQDSIVILNGSYAGKVESAFLLDGLLRWYGALACPVAGRNQGQTLSKRSRLV
ncbi:MAG: VCBS repeat-containing protein, partial [Alphaproteobacteria bacterium]|nr:VCBS repeat-containing protein [Alphaproteobacteria bacterium]